MLRPNDRTRWVMTLAELALNPPSQSGLQDDSGECRAMAVVTHESIPPLNKTTALGCLLIVLGTASSLCLDAIPDYGVYTPRVAGCHMNLCNCKPSRTGMPSARIHSARSRALIPGQVPSGSTCTGENTT